MEGLQRREICKETVGKLTNLFRYGPGVTGSPVPLVDSGQPDSGPFVYATHDHDHAHFTILHRIYVRMLPDSHRIP
jgi:hypothetical protein